MPNYPTMYKVKVNIYLKEKSDKICVICGYLKAKGLPFLIAHLLTNPLNSITKVQFYRT